MDFHSLKFLMQSLNSVQVNLNMKNVKEKDNQTFSSLKLFFNNNHLKSKKILRWFQKILNQKKWKSTPQTCLNLKLFQFNKRWSSKFCRFYLNTWQIMKIKKTRKKIKMTAKISVHLQLFVTQRLFVNLIRSLSNSIYTSYSIWYVFMALGQGSLVIERKLGKLWSN